MSTYNQKLFSGGLRGRLHQMRFKWLQKHLREKENAYSLFELGCFDCRSLRFIPKPSRYVGADAGWEGGIEDARMTHTQTPWIELVTAQSVQDLAHYKDQRFDYSVSLETLEHIPDHVLRGYIEFLARVTKKQLLVSVPVEIGPIFLAKYLAKAFFPELESGETSSYTWREVWAATRGESEKIRRFEHKGFDYRTLIKLIGEYFNIVHVEGIPLSNVPHLSFQVGIIAEPKRNI